MPVTEDQANSRKRYGLFVLAILAFLSGIIFMIFFESKYPLTLGFAGLMFFVSARLVKESNIYATRARRTDIVLSGSDALKHITPLEWTFGVVSAMATVGSFLYLYIDILNGSHSIWPLYVFAASMLVAIGVWSGLIARLMN